MWFVAIKFLCFYILRAIIILVMGTKEKKEKKKNKSKEKPNYKALLKVLKYSKKATRWVVFVLILGISCMGLWTLVPFFNAQITLSITSYNADELLKWAIVLMIVDIAALAIGVCWNFTARVMNWRMTRGILRDFSRAFTKVEMKHIDRTNNGTFVSRFNTDINEVANFIDSTIDRVLNILAKISVIVYLFTLHIYFGVVVISLLVLCGLIFFFEQRIRGKFRKTDKEMRQRISGLTNEFVRGIKDIKILNFKETMLKKYDDKCGEREKYSIKWGTILTMISNVRWCIDICLSLVIILISIILVSQGQIIPATIIIAFQFAGGASQTIRSIFEIFTSTVDATVSAERICDVLEDEKFTKEVWGTKEVPNLHGNIEFKNVKFSYEKAKKKSEDDNSDIIDSKEDIEFVEIFKDLNFEIEKNTTVAFCGGSGEGKTTIANLICKSYEIGSGSISIGGHDIRDITEESLKSSLSIVSQSPYIFDGTFAENLQLVKESATEEEIKDALRKAQLLDFVEEQRDGINTKVGENGVQLSGGQRQRLAIARCLLKDSNIIIFDEATSALDNNSQAEIKKVLDELKSKKTIIIIAHRLSTIVDSDCIFFLKNHGVFAHGTHSKLLKTCKEYKGLYKVEE